MAEIHGRIDDHDPAPFRERFRIIFAIIAIALAVLVIRLWYLQIIRGDELRQRSENNSVRLRKIHPARGLIKDRHGTVLVDNQPAFDLIFVPNRTREAGEVIRKLATLYGERSLSLAVDPATIKKSSYAAPLRLEKAITMEKLAIVETHSLELPGVLVDVAPIRQYLRGASLAHVIGYMGEINQDELAADAHAGASAGDDVGKAGIEKYMDAYLRGRNGAEQVEVNALGRATKVLGQIAPVPGYNVVLTIDAELQQVAADALGDRAGAAVAMDTRTGEILALASSPSFDPNLFNGGISHEEWNKLAQNARHPMENRAISGQYPPGSTYKPIVAAAALQEGLINQEASVLCTGGYTLGSRTYRCWQKRGHGMVNLHRALVESCDVYFYTVGKLVGVDRLAWYAGRCGLGAPTGVDLPREKGGLVPTKAWKLAKCKEPWQMGETISTSIGQGFNLVTPLQLARTYSALANGGVLWRPRIVKALETPDGRIFKVFAPEKTGVLPVSPQVLETVRHGLWGVVNERGGTGYALKRKEQDVCGKTGTSQVFGLPQNERARRATRITRRLQDHALFACFAPCKNPEIAVAVIAEHAGHGGAAAAPVARKIIDAYFARKKAAPMVAAAQGAGR